MNLLTRLRRSRQRTEKPFDRKQSQSIENTKRYVHRSGKVVTPIWVASKPPTQYTSEPIVMLGEIGLHPDELYSQGITRAVVRGKEMLVTDWWATKYKSGWQGYVPKSSYKIILKRGERLRDVSIPIENSPLYRSKIPHP